MGLLTNMSLSMQLRLRILKTYIWLRPLYGFESWTIKSDMKKNLEAVEMWFMRRILRVPWISRRTNLAVLEIGGTSTQLMTTIRRKQLGHLCHTLRGTSLGKDCSLGVVKVTRVRGRQKFKYMYGIKTLVRCRTAGVVVRLAEDRGRWRSIVANDNSEDTAPW